MKIITKVKNLDLTSDVQEFIEQKIGSIKKFIDILKEDAPEKGRTLAEVFIEIEKETDHHKKGNIFLVKAHIVLPGKKLTAESRSDDMFNAVSAVKKELKIEIDKYKLKNIDKNRRQQKKLKKEISI